MTPSCAPAFVGLAFHAGPTDAGAGDAGTSDGGIDGGLDAGCPDRDPTRVPGTFVLSTHTVGATEVREPLLGDLDGDGDLDAFLTKRSCPTTSG